MIRENCCSCKESIYGHDLTDVFNFWSICKNVSADDERMIKTMFTNTYSNLMDDYDIPDKLCKTCLDKVCESQKIFYCHFSCQYYKVVEVLPADDRTSDGNTCSIGNVYKEHLDIINRKEKSVIINNPNVDHNPIYDWYSDCTTEYLGNTAHIVLKDSRVLFTCTHCNENEHYCERISIVDDSLCQTCSDELVSWCDSCEDSIWSDDAQWDNDYPYCQGCYDDRMDDRDDDDGYGIIHSYSYVPSYRYIHSSWETRIGKYNRFIKPKYLGIELEVNLNEDENRTCTAEDALSYLGDDCYIKSDSSIDYGFEIVSHPMTFYSHKKFSWYNKLKSLRELNLTSYEMAQAGIHIHCSSNSLKITEWWKVVMFFHLCRKNLIVFSQRRESQIKSWCNFRNIDDYNYDLQKKLELDNLNSNNTETPLTLNSRYMNIVSLIQKLKLYEIYPRAAGRYNALHFTGKGTYEFRFFRGTTDYKRFNACIEFVEAITEYVREIGFGYFNRAFINNNTNEFTTDDKVWIDFINWCFDQKEYSYFTENQMNRTNGSISGNLPFKEIHKNYSNKELEQCV